MAIVELPNGDTLEVPDDYSQEQVQKAVSSILSQSAQPKGLLSQLGRIPELIGEEFQKGGETAQSAFAPNVSLLSRIGRGLGGSIQQLFSPVTGTIGALVGEPVQQASLAAGAPPALAQGIRTAAEAAPLMINPSTALRATATTAKNIGEAGKAVGESALKQVGKHIGKYTPEELYMSAAKMTTAVPPEQRTRIFKALYENEIPIGREGYDLLTSKINDLNETRMVEMIGPKSKERLRIDGPLRYIYEEGNKALSKTLNKEGFSKEFNKEIDNYIKQYSEGLTVGEAQKLKSGIYADIEHVYKRDVPKYKQDAEIVFKKALARGMKDSIVEVVPEVAALNAQESALLEASPFVAKSANRLANHDIFGLGDIMAAGAGAAMGGPAGGTALGLLNKVLRSPEAKTKAAYALESLRRRGLSSELTNRPVVTPGSSKPVMME